MDTENRYYYVYKWFFKDTGEIFHIGKGCKNRYKDTVNHRNAYFRNIIKKYSDNVSSEIIVDNLSESEAFDLERKFISEYKEIGWCKTNLHEGGCGGFTGNYDSPERSEKIRVHARTRTGSKNPMYGHHHSEETRKKIGVASKGRKLSEEHKQKLKQANTGRVKTEKEIESIRQRFKGVPLSKSHYIKMMYADSKRYFVVKYKDSIIYSTISKKKLEAFAKERLKISKSIIWKIIKGKYLPSFSRNEWLIDIHIYVHVLDESVKSFLNSDEIERVTISDEILKVFENVVPSHYNKTEEWKDTYDGNS